MPAPTRRQTKVLGQAIASYGAALTKDDTTL